MQSSKIPSSRLPNYFLPEFTWPLRAATPFASEIPPTPKPTHWLIRRFWGFVHQGLEKFSYLYYCRWVGIKYDNQIIPLPFGLVLKWSDGTRLEEALAMQVARAAGFPVPKVVCYGDHPHMPHAPISILMTRIPGKELGQVYETMSDHEKESVLSEVKACLDAMRKWTNPWGRDHICSISGGAIRSVRVPFHLVGPCENEQEFNKCLISAAQPPDSEYGDDFETLLIRARRMQSLSHPIVFTHGDLKHHNLMVDKGHLTGFIDWESCGWQPDYWDFTTALRFARKEFWWHDFAMKLGGDKYLVELDCDRALNNLTSSSYYW